MTSRLVLKALRSDSPQDVCPQCMPVMQAQLQAAHQAHKKDTDRQSTELTAMIEGIENRLLQLIGEIEASIERVNADILRAVLPSFTAPSTLRLLNGALRDELERNPSGDLEIIIHPDNTLVRDWVSKNLQLPITLITDEDLGALECRLRWADGERIIDAERVVDACLEIFEAEA